MSVEEIQGKAPKTWLVVLATIGLLGIAVGTLLPILQAKSNPYAFYNQQLQPWMFVYAGGALVYLVAKLMTPFTGKNLRVKRLYRIEAWSAVFFCVAAFFVFYDRQTTRDVWAFTLAGGILLIFTNIAIPIVVKRELKKNS